MEKSARLKPDPYSLNRFLWYGFFYILIFIPVLSLFFSSRAAHGYGYDSVEMVMIDSLFPYNQSVRIIHEIIDGQTAYIAFQDNPGGSGETYGIAAVDLGDQSGSGILWSINFTEYIVELAQDGATLYITTCAGDSWMIDLAAPDGPRLQELPASQETGMERRFRVADALNPYYTSQYSAGSYSGNWNSFSGTYPWSIGSGFNFLQNYQVPNWSPTSFLNQSWNQYSFPGSFQSYTPQLPMLYGSPFSSFQNYQVPNWSQPSFLNQSWNQYSFPGSFQSYTPQLPMLYGSPFSFPGQYSTGGWSYPTSIFSLNALTGLSGLTNGWTPITPWAGSSQSSTPSSTVSRYRSPVSVTLPLSNPSSEDITGQITLRLKNLKGNTVSEQEKTITLESGQGDCQLSLSKVPEGTGTKDFAKYNLRYSFGGVTDEKSLFQVADKMEVRLKGSDSLYAGQPTTVGVHALVHGRPVSIEDASVTVDLVNGSTTRRMYSGKTDANGFAEARMDVPEGMTGSWKIRAKVSSGFGSETMTRDVEIVRLYKILLTTDKPIYQPGQTIHIRTLTLKKPDLLPEGGQEIIIEVEDPKGNKVFRVNPRTDEFGVASADFVLGTDINLGLYTVRAIRVEDGIPTQSEKKVTVERYVLPKFKVDLETNAEYYSPGDTVHGVVDARYFFGKALSGAEVTIEASKFDVDFVLFQTITGYTDESGFFSFDLVLPAYFVGLPLEQGKALVKLDIKVKDTAEHEETIIRELTVTKDPIIIKLVPESGSVVPGVENILYLLTTDPKGRGLATSNQIDFDGQTLNVNTDAQGIGSFTVTPDIGSNLLCKISSQANGQAVYAEIGLSDDLDVDRILLRTDKAVYKAGETMTIDIYTPEVMARRVFVDIIRDRQTMLTEGVDLIDGQGQLIVDLSHDMTGTLLVEAYYISLATDTASDIFRDRKTVYVNPADDIQVTVALDKDEYLPGEKARIEFQVLPAQTAALGVTIVDEAVYALQENNPGLLKVYFNLEKEIMKPRFWPLIVPYEEAVCSDDPEEEVQEVLEIVFASAEEPDDSGLDESSYPNLVQRMKEALVSRINEDADRVAKDLGDLRIFSNAAYKEALRDGRFNPVYTDPWGNLYILEVGTKQVVVTSCGPDEKWGTIDDISLTKPYKPVYTYKPFLLYTYYSGWYGYAAYSSGGGGGGGGGGSTITGSQTQAGFLSPTDQPGEEPPAEEIETQEPRKIRRDFPETLLWEPSLITDPDGKAYLDANMADSITTWRMSTVASNLNGQLGGGTAGIVVFQDFFIDLDLPVTLTRNDEISMPVAVYNYLDEPQTVRVELKTDQESQWFELIGDSEKLVNLAAGEVTVVYFRIKALEVGWHELTVFGYGTRMSDAMARRIEVVPDGMEFNVNVSDRMKGNVASHVLHIPTEAIDGASKILVKVYPGIFSQVVEGLEKLLKVPYG